MKIVIKIYIFSRNVDVTLPLFLFAFCNFSYIKPSWRAKV